MPPWLLSRSTLALALLAAVSGALADSRCFLDGGGSAESFFVSEDLPVGSVIGTLRIVGDPRQSSGDIGLTLRERDSPVTIAPGTGDLVLTTALDKEGITGPSSVYVNVICDRKHSLDPSFVIPVNIRVTDTNDNPPRWVGAPYTLTLSEVTVPGTRVLQGARAVDVDQQGPFSTVEYSVLPGPNADLLSFISPLEGTLLLRKPLDFETTPNFTVGLRAQDQGSPPLHSDTTLEVIVIDADDQNPKFLDEAYTAVVPENATQGTKLHTLPRPISAFDQDQGIGAPLGYSFAPPVPPEARLFFVHPRTGELSVTGALKPGDLQQPVTLVLKATQLDNPDRYALATLIFSRYGLSRYREYGSHPMGFLQPAHHVAIPENTPVGSRILSIQVNKPGERIIRYYVVEKGCRGVIGVLGGPTSGEVVLKAPLDYEVAAHHKCHVIATDGRTNSTTLLNVTVTNVNDWEPRFRFPHYEFFMTTNGGAVRSGNGAPRFSAGVLLGRLEAADGDRGDRISLSLRGPHSNLFTLDNTGALFIRPSATAALSYLNLSAIHLVATATDSGSPPRSSSVPITIHLPSNGGAPLGGARAASMDWGLMGMFAGVLGIFGVVIAVLSAYIYRVKKPKTTNRIHSTGGFLHREKHPQMGATGPHLGVAPFGALGGSASTLSAGASTIIANSLERGAQLTQPDYTSSVRSRAGMRSDSPSPESEMSGAHQARAMGGLWTHQTITVPGGVIMRHEQPLNTNMPPRVKKLSWGNGDDIKNEDPTSTAVVGPSQLPDNTNLTVYF